MPRGVRLGCTTSRGRDESFCLGASSADHAALARDMGRTRPSDQQDEILVLFLRLHRMAVLRRHFLRRVPDSLLRLWGDRMRYKIEIDGDVLLDVFHWLENTGRYQAAVAIRDQYVVQQRQALKRLDDLGKGASPQKSASAEEALKVFGEFFGGK